ncbi:hypothetical protein [Paenibacillus senegalensis]|uniref:hypothetical protein n=1 Tax=Paenibacillus senegalensis TaxID=1465766 RepID=UPI000311F5BD|nr:hypothetical protein [Paenibacillus senegalensis]
MKKRYLLLAGFLSVGIITVALQANGAKQPQIPEPYISFEGGQVVFADHIPQCH